MAGRRWTIALASAGTFLAVAGIGVGLVAAHESGTARVTPGVSQVSTHGPANGPAEGSAGSPANGSAGVKVGQANTGPLVLRLTQPPRIVHVVPSGVRVIPLQTKPLSGICNGPMVPAGGTPPPCPGN